MDMDRLEHVERRVDVLERNYETLRGELTSVQNGQLRLENTVLTEFKESKELTKQLINHQFQLDKKKLSGREKIMVTLITAVGGFLGTGGFIALLDFLVNK